MRAGRPAEDAGAPGAPGALGALDAQGGAGAPGALDAAAGSAPAFAGPAHLHALDLVRFVTVAGVIAVHATSLTAGHDLSVPAGAVLVVLHVTREVFLALSAFVLAYRYRDRPLRTRAFWRRRYPLVLAPYVMWSAIYVIADGHLRSPWQVLGRFGFDLLDAGAHFQLYFLLLTFQLYLVFPALLALLKRHPKRRPSTLVAAAAFELAFTAAIHSGWRPPVLGIWLSHPGSWLPSYPLYVVGGVVAALEHERLTGWVRRHSALLGWCAAGSVALGIGGYAAQLVVLGWTPLAASAVFQPSTVVESVAITLALYALGLRVASRAGPRREARLERSADVSFGVYLAHPLLVAALLDVAVATGLSAAVAALPAAVVEVLAVAGLMPAVYAVTFAAVAAARRGPLSLALTGRPRPPRRAASPRSAPRPLYPPRS